ncbi:hypothetical protein NL676_024037 [Syzygium grande]|nr:hypothetical protein NL676_024037 [Syzygium grande]
MSHPGKPEVGFDALSDRFGESLSCEFDKPDFRELDLGSPVSPLRTRQSGLTATATTTTTTTTTSSSSSSSGSVSGRNALNVVARRPDSGTNHHSGELSGSSDNSPTAGSGKAARNFYSGQARSDSASTHHTHYSGQSSVNSPPLNVLPSGNICPSGRILKTGMAVNRSSRSDVLGSGMGNYGHGSIMRGGGIGPMKGVGVGGGGGEASIATPRVVGGSGESVRRAMGGLDPEEVKRAGNEQYRRGNFQEALMLYDRAIALSPSNAAYRSNRAAALTGLGRLADAVRECEVAVNLDPKYWRAHQRLASLFIRLGQVENARRHMYIPGSQPDSNEQHKLQAVEKHLSRCADARRVGEWKTVLREGDAAIAAGADFSCQLFMCRVEALLKLHQLEEAELSLNIIPKLEPPWRLMLTC